MLSDDDLKRKYIDLLSTILDRKRDYKARTGIRRSDGNKRMEEITIMKMMNCIELKDMIMKTHDCQLFKFGQHRDFELAILLIPSIKPSHYNHYPSNDDQLLILDKYLIIAISSDA